MHNSILQRWAHTFDVLSCYEGWDRGPLQQSHFMVTYYSFYAAHNSYCKYLFASVQGISIQLLVNSHHSLCLCLSHLHCQLAYLSSSSEQKWHSPLPSLGACRECVSQHQQASSLGEESDLVFLVANPLPFNRQVFC